MVCLAKQKRGEKEYYYLVENIKIAKGRRKQLRKYVGKQKPSNQKLKILISQFEKQVNKEKQRITGYHYLTKDEIMEIDKINSEFWQGYEKQNKTVQEQFDQNFVMVFVFNTNSIEGSTLTLREVELLLDQGIAPRKPLDDVLEARAAQKCLKFIKEYRGDLNQEFLLKLHESYFKDSKPGIAGKYKTMENRVRGSAFRTSPVQFVLTDMKLFFKDYKKLKTQLHPLELAAWAHWKLVRVHPFQDGNGRIARLLMNFVLCRNDYAMIDIKTKEKQVYFNALEKSHYANSARPLSTHLVRRFRKQYKNALKP